MANHSQLPIAWLPAAIRDDRATRPQAGSNQTMKSIGGGMKEVVPTERTDI
ncbi:hypothetical protein AMC86_PB00105 (plasmid) [Rhizobium phaseoli]|nr:hypothetical protein AMC86_PB00105 [Rhizobium phaseoli]